MKFCITSDVHFERVLRENEGFEHMIKYFKETLEYIKPDIFIIAGDLTDSRNLRFETPEAAKLVKFMQFLLEITKKNNIELVVLKGTPSHDGDIVKNLNVVTSRYNHFTYIDSICRLTLRGANFVFIPETYSPTYEDFELELHKYVNVNNKADVIVFHGMFDFAIPAVKQIDSKHNLSRSVVMNSSKISKYANIIIGGHVHSFIKEKNIYYTGRFINERGHNYKSDEYGIKYVKLTNDSFVVKNIDNPYVIKQDVVFIDLVNFNYDDENIRRKMIVNNINDVIFHVRVSANDKERFKQWKSAYDPIYIKKENVKQADGDKLVQGVKIDTITETDILELLKTTYKRTYEEELTDDVIKMIENGDDDIEY